MRITDQLGRALEDGLRLHGALPDILLRIRDAMPGQPRAASYEAKVSGGESDPTADAGLRLAEGDHADADLAQLRRSTRIVAIEIERMVRIAAAWQSRGPTRKEQRETEAANDNLQPACELHLRVGVRVPRHRLAEVAYGWALDRPMSLCHQCMRRIGDTHHVPDDDEMRYLVDHGKWPKLITTSAYSRPRAS